MVTVNRVMVGVDFSKDSDASLTGAMHIAALHHADVYAVHVIDNRPEDDLLNPAVEHRKQIQDALERRLRRVVEDAGIELKCEQLHAVLKTGRPTEELLLCGSEQFFRGAASLHAVLKTGRPTEELLAAAEEFDADVVVVGNRGKGLIERTLLGSVASSLVRRLERPLIVTRGWKGASERRRLAAGDLSDDSVRVIQVAARPAE